jgi:phage gp29-like protein
MPYHVGKLPRGKGQDEYDKLRDLLEDMVQDAIAVIPDDASVEILSQGSNSSSADNYEKLIESCKKEISVVNLGHENAARSTPGRLGGEDVAVKVMDNIRDVDTKMVEATVNQLIDWIYFLNFGDGPRPKFSMWVPEEVDKELADRDQVLYQTGVRFTKPYFVKNYQLEEEDFDLPVAPPPPDPNAPPAPGLIPKFKEKAKPVTPEVAAKEYPDQAALEDALSSMDPAHLQSMMETLLKPVLPLLQTGTDAETVMKKLAECYPLMDESQLQQLLAQAIFVMQTFARLKSQQ